MASIFLFLLFSLMAAVGAQQRTWNISLNSSLSPTGNNTFWLSPSGLFAFGFFPNGNGFAIGIWFTTPHRTVVWTANRDDPPIPTSAVLDLTADGRLVLRQEGNQEKSIVNTSRPATFASIRDSGNFVLYAADLSIIWQSFDHPIDTLLSGQLLPAQNRLVSGVSETNHSSGIFELVMQGDGNLVMYPVDLITIPGAYWATNTAGSGNNVTLKLDGNGHIFLLNSSGVNIKSIREAGSSSKTYRLTLDTGGLLRLYSLNSALNYSWSIEWSSSKDVCRPNGVCGINQYCERVDEQPVCTCLPSYAPVDPERTNLGCYRNFTPETCVSISGNSRYDMQKLDNVVWLFDEKYSLSSSMTIDGCSQACLDDCKCEAAVFQNQECGKQKMPLRFGKRDIKSDVVTLIKTGVEGLVDQKSSSSSRTKLRKAILAVSITIGIIFFSFIFCCILRNTRTEAKATRRGQEYTNWDLDLPLFDLAVIVDATNNFSQENIIGKGGFGPVYKGNLSTGEEIAVKRLSKDSGQGVEQFMNEVDLIVKLQHRNLVALLGCCIQGEERMLIYEYMPNKSLDHFIFDHRQSTLLGWEQRFNIILGIARGLLYLHQDSKLQIIHRDLKTSNILLDIDLNPKISDFGLARILEVDQMEAITKRVVGTYGYMSPEYAIYGKISIKSDVFSIGVILLEVVTGKRNREFCYSDNSLNLLGHAWSLWNEGRVVELVDKNLKDSCITSQVMRCIQVGLLCVQNFPGDRPAMASVVFMLANEDAVLPRPKQPGFFEEGSSITDVTESSSNKETYNSVTITMLDAR